MPIVTIQRVVSTDTEAHEPAAIQAVADDLGGLWGMAPGETWVRLSYLPKEQYAENQSAPASMLPTFVEVLKRHLPNEEKLAEEATRVVEIVAAALALPSEQVHVIFLPEGVGRVAFGGRLERS